MIIKKFDELATTDLRKDILKIAEAGYEAISIAKLIGEELSIKSSILTIQGESYDLNNYKNIYVVAIGKGCSLIAERLESLIGAGRIKAGVAIDLKHKKLKKN